MKKTALSSVVILIEAVRPLQYWTISPFITCGSKEAGAKCIGHLITISKGESL